MGFDILGLEPLRQRIASWTIEDTARLRIHLAKFDIALEEHRVPYTLAVDFYRNHGMPEVRTRSEASERIKRIADNAGASHEFMYALLMLCYLVQDGITTGYPTALAIANDEAIREPFEIVHRLNVTLPFHGI